MSQRKRQFTDVWRCAQNLPELSLSSIPSMTLSHHSLCLVAFVLENSISSLYKPARSASSLGESSTSLRTLCRQVDSKSQLIN